MKEKTKIFVFDNCCHIFHGSCLRAYFKSEIEDSKFPLHCPLPECGEEVKISEVKNLLKPKLFDLFQERLINLAVDTNPDMSWCPTPDCNYAFVFEEGENEFMCQQCKKHYCLNCRSPFHLGETCAEYRISNNFSDQD